MRTPLTTLTLSDAARRLELAEVAGRLGADVAVLQGEGPELVNQLDEPAGLGPEPMYLAGVIFGDDLGPASWLGHVARWWLDSCGPLLELWCSRRPLYGLPGELPCPGETRRLGPHDSFTSPNWEQPPPVSRQVSIYHGPRYNAKDALKTQETLSRALAGTGVLDESVLLTVTGYCYPCSRAPIVVAQLDMEWLDPVTPDDVPILVKRLVRWGGTDRIIRPCGRGGGVPATSALTIRYAVSRFSGRTRTPSV